MTKKIFYIIVISVILIMGGFLSFLLLPFTLDQFILPQIAQKLPFHSSRISLVKISPWQIRGALHLGDQEKRGVVVPNFEIHFEPRNLWKRKISQIIIDAPVVHFERNEGQITVRGLQLKGTAEDNKSTKPLPNLPIAIEKITIRDGLIVYHEDEMRRHNLNIEGSLLPRYHENTDEGISIKNITAIIATHGILPSLSEIQAEVTEEGMVATYSTQIQELEAIMAGVPQFEQIEIGGQAEISGTIKTGGRNILRNYTTKIRIANFLIKRNGVEIGSKSEREPFSIDLEGNEKQLDFGLSHLMLHRPGKTDLNLVGTIDLATISFSGRATTTPSQISSPLITDFNGKVETEGLLLDFKLHGNSFDLTKDITIGGASGSGLVEFSKGAIAGKFSGKIPHVEDSKSEIALKDITLDVPFNFPAVAPGVIVPGNLVINTIEYKGNTSGKLQAAVEIAQDEVIINSLLTTPVNTEFQLTCNGSVNTQREGMMNCFLPKFSIDTSTISPFVTLPEGLEVSGNVTAESRLQMVGESLSGDAQLSYEEGSVDFGDYKFSQIDLQLGLPKLPTIQSKPSQLATIGNVELGNIKMSDAAIRFRLDDQNTVFIEGVRLNWCGGRVETGGLQLYKNMEELDTTLYCDRLGYTELLNQLGVGDAEGEGSLNGRLPLFINKDGIRFDDGFLFSTPGDSGIVRFKNTEQLRQGMPSIEQAAYLDYSLEALENFSYNWTKLTFNTEAKQLVLALQLDGKPAAPLPYGYKQGQIVKSETGRGLQHPIRLDVNFRLPLDDLFHYGKNIQSIMENM